MGYNQGLHYKYDIQHNYFSNRPIMETFLLVRKCYVKDHIGKSNLENFIKKLVNPSRKAKKVGGRLLEQ